MSTAPTRQNVAPGLLLGDRLPMLLVVGRAAFYMVWKRPPKPVPDTVVVRPYTGLPVFVGDEAARGYAPERLVVVRHVTGLKLPEGQQMVVEMPRTLMKLPGRDGRTHELCAAAAYLVGIPSGSSGVARFAAGPSRSTDPASPSQDSRKSGSGPAN